MPIDTSPHEYDEPEVRWWQRRKRYCRHCYYPEEVHPRRGYTMARPLHDSRRLSASEAVRLELQEILLNAD